jgi:hypothetical protein
MAAVRNLNTDQARSVQWKALITATKHLSTSLSMTIIVLCCAQQMGTHGMRIVSSGQPHLGHDVAGTLLRGERISSLRLTHEEHHDAIRAIYRRN